MPKILYFAYGSNLDEAQMHERCPAAELACAATLRDYALCFGGFSHTWGGAVANVVPASGSGVPGLLYRIGRKDLRRLDRREGHPFAYQRTRVRVVDARGCEREAIAYVQPGPDFEAWPPPMRYFQQLLRAYERLGFDRLLLARAVVAAGAE